MFRCAFRHIGRKAFAFQPVARTSHLLQLSAAVAEAGAGRRGKGDDRLATEVIVFDESIYRPGSDAPPDRISDEDRIVAFPVVCLILDQRDVAQAGIIVFAIDAAVPVIVVQIRFGILLDRFQFHDIAVSRFGNVIGYILGMTASRIIDDQRLAIALGRSLGRRIRLF